MGPDVSLRLILNKEEGSKKYTAFADEGSGLWHFKQMLFGLTGSSAMFCQLVNLLFGPKDQPHIFAYLDEIERHDDHHRDV